MRRFTMGWAIVLCVVGLIQPLRAIAAPVDEAQAKQAIARGLDYLRKTQAEDGSWKSRASLGVTALVVTAMLDRPDISANDPTVAKALAYMMTKVKPDGGIHEGMLQTYTTAVCLSAFSRLGNDPKMQPIIKKAQQYLCTLQWVDQQTRDGQTVTSSHPYYGGAGYGPGSRPDLSNTALMLEALRDSGMDCNDPVFKRAIQFVSSMQAVEGNKQLEGKADPDGGFVYVMAPGSGPGSGPGRGGRGAPGNGEGGQRPQRSEAAPDEASSRRMSSYGSMTYAGYMSYAYAQIDAKDPRVVAASKWIGSHYALDVNPGMPAPMAKAGLYYYYMLFSRAMHAWGSPNVTTADGKTHVWADDLTAQIVSLQREDGSWVNGDSSQWGENDPVLVTAYAIIALNQAGR